jgi:hypothetical protein
VWDFSDGTVKTTGDKRGQRGGAGREEGGGQEDDEAGSQAPSPLCLSEKKRTGPV